MKKIIPIVLIWLFVLPAFAGQFEAIIYCNKRNPAVVEGVFEHWKPNIPDVGVDEVIRDFKVLERRDGKIVVHALVEILQGQMARIKEHLRVINGCDAPEWQGVTCSTPVGQQVLAWWGKTADEAYTRLWKSRGDHLVFEIIAKEVLRYPVETTCDGEACVIIVSITEAETTYSEVISPQKIMVPHRFYGR